MILVCLFQVNFGIAEPILMGLSLADRLNYFRKRFFPKTTKVKSQATASLIKILSTYFIHVGKHLDASLKGIDLHKHCLISSSGASAAAFNRIQL